MGEFVRPTKRATTVLAHLGSNTAFKELYDKHTRSPIACMLANNSDHPGLVDPSTIFTPENLQGWNFDESSIDQDPVARVIKRDLTSYVSLPVKIH